MRILQLDIEGFRSLKQISWKPGDLNVVIGANGTGKSNLLRFLELMSTHSPQFLDAFIDTKPTTTVAKWENGETTLKVLEGEQLDYWLREYTLGALFRSGELEGMG